MLLFGTIFLILVTTLPSRVDGTDEWLVAQGKNDCNTPWKEGPCGKPEDSPGFHYVGSLPNASACQATCEVATSNCSIWLWSSGTKHCWWRLDGVWAPTVQKNVVSSCRQVSSKTAACVPGCGVCPMSPTPGPIPPPPFVPSKKPNMNGKYILSQTPHGHSENLFPEQYRDYPRGVEYFDIYSPLISQLYSQVFWKGLDPVPLPDEIVKRYHGRGMAVVGFEMDQVRKTSSGDVSVPINVVYNHHFESNMVGAKSSLEKVTFDGPDDPRRSEIINKMGHGIPLKEAWIVNDHAPDNSIPTSQSFGGANGGEYRKSFHGYAPGFAQIIDSPQVFHITPMQIDTWNRDEMNLTGPTRFVSGPVPRTSVAPIGPGAQYSGLLECPLTTRVRKIIDAAYNVRASGTCPEAIDTASECFEATSLTLNAGALVRKRYINNSISDVTKPKGCSATTDAVNANTVNVYFNNASSNSVSQCASKSILMSGFTSSLVKVMVELDVAKQIATINLTGPASVWFGVGFNSSMKSKPWTIIVDGAGKVTERQLADQSPGKELPPSVKVISSTLIDGFRNVIITRPFKGLTEDYFTFDPISDTKIPFINAIGKQSTLSYHKERTPSDLFLLPVKSAGACICPSKPLPFGQQKGKLTYVKTDQPGDIGGGTVSWNNNCAPQPRTDMLAMKNPTCDIRSYVGGQISCHHMWSLLDADQEIPWADQPLEYHLKFRFWVQPFNKSYHTNARRTTWGIASPVEYDVPKCKAGIMGCSQLPDGTWIHTIHGTFTGGGHLLAAHFHCHAPTCLSIAMYKCEKSVKVCNATTGTLLCREEPIYGGTGKIDDKRFDEPGYILQPPCIWGSPEYGLESPPDVTGLTLHSVKTSNATYGHHGEMAWQQMYYY